MEEYIRAYVDDMGPGGGSAGALLTLLHRVHVGACQTVCFVSAHKVGATGK